MPYENKHNLSNNPTEMDFPTTGDSAEVTLGTLRDQADLAQAIRSKQIPEWAGTELDPNRSGNIYDELAAAGEPVDPQKTGEYLEAEGFGAQMESVGSVQEALGLVALTESEGVTLNVDGSITLGADGNSHRITQDGVPTQNSEQQPPQTNI